MTSDTREELHDNGEAVSLSKSYLVLSGPGTGKTRHIVDRITQVLSAKIDRPSRALALTFTNKAAGELKERVSESHSRDDHTLFVGTFHSFGHYILRNHGDQLGVGGDPLVFDDTDRLEIVENLQSRGRLPAGAAPGTILRAVDRLKSRASATGRSIEELPGVTGEVRTIATEYERTLAQAGAIDFSDMIYKANLLLTRFPERRELLKVAYSHLIIDEFQDTTPGQYFLLCSLFDPFRSRVFAVADEDQLIYEWNDAKVDTINRLIKDVEPQILYSTLSYRCPPRVVAAANAVIVHNRLRFPDKPEIRSDPRHPTLGHLTLIEAPDPEAEALAIAGRIQEHATAGVPLDAIAVLARAGWLLDGIENLLQDRGISSGRPSLAGLGESEEADLLLRLLRWVNSRRDEMSARRVVLFLSPKTFEDAEKSLQSSDPVDIPYESLLADHARGSPESAGFLRFLEHLARWRLGLGNAPWLLREMSAELPALMGEMGVEESRARTVIQGLGTLERQILKSNPRGQISLTEALLELPRVVNPSDARAGAVQLLTIHQAKGLGFSVVFLCGLEDGVLPDYRTEGQPRAIEEERRLFYVGITRCRSDLVLSYARTRKTASGLPRDRKPSPFIAEIPDQLFGS